MPADPLGQAREILAALGGYLADRLDEPAGRFVGGAGIAFLRERGLPADFVAAWSTLVAQCEELSFGANPALDPRGLHDEAVRLLTNLERRGL